MGIQFAIFNDFKIRFPFGLQILKVVLLLTIPASPLRLVVNFDVILTALATKYLTAEPAVMLPRKKPEALLTNQATFDFTIILPKVGLLDRFIK